MAGAVRPALAVPAQAGTARAAAAQPHVDRIDDPLAELGAGLGQGAQLGVQGGLCALLASPKRHRTANKFVLLGTAT